MNHDATTVSERQMMPLGEAVSPGAAALEEAVAATLTVTQEPDASDDWPWPYEDRDHDFGDSSEEESMVVFEFVAARLRSAGVWHLDTIKQLSSQMSACLDEALSENPEIDRPLAVASLLWQLQDIAADVTWRLYGPTRSSQN